MVTNPEICILDNDEVAGLVPRSWKRLQDALRDNSADMLCAAEVYQGFHTTDSSEVDDEISACVELLQAEFSNIFSPANLTLTVLFDQDADDQEYGDPIGYQWEVSGHVELTEGGQKLMKACA